MEDIQIIPAINVEKKEDFETQLRQIESFAPIAQIDIQDGEFLDKTSWADPAQIAAMNPSIQFELHLMVKHPFEVIEQWAAHTELISRVMIHASSVPKEALVHAIKNQDTFDWETGIVLDLDVPTSVLDPIVEELRYVMVMGVPVGPSGQGFDERALDKIVSLRDMHERLNIEVDGGVNKETIQRMVDAGANILCSGSGIFNDNASAEENYNELLALARN